MLLSVDGKSVFAYTAGKPLDPARPSVVFIHGAGNDHTVWQLQSRYFGYHGYNALAVDLPGHGRSQGPALASIETLAAWIPRCLDAAEVGSAALAGHSMGALIALEAAAEHPERVEAAALLGIAAPMRVSPALLAAAHDDHAAAVEMISTWGLSRGARVGSNPAPGMWMRGGVTRLLERSAPGVLYTDLAACNEYAGALPSARRIRCPVLLVLGRGDLMTPPRTADELAGALPGAHRVLLAGCGHMMMSEQPEPVLEALWDFLATGQDRARV